VNDIESNAKEVYVAIIKGHLLRLRHADTLDDTSLIA